MSLNVGSRLGHYDVTALIGEGGMGQVYQATDTKLNRQVAFNVLPLIERCVDRKPPGGLGALSWDIRSVHTAVNDEEKRR